MTKTKTKTKKAHNHKHDHKHDHNHGHNHDHSHDHKPDSPILENTVVKITVPKKDADEAYKKALKKLSKSIKVDGFRKGNVPPKIAEENLNPEAIIEEALKLVIPDLYNKAVADANLRPITYPEFSPVSLEKGKEWMVNAHIALQPEVNLKSYKSIVKKAKKEAEKEIAKQAKDAKQAQKKADGKQPVQEPSEEAKKNFTLQVIFQRLVDELKPKVQELLVKEEVKYDLDNLSQRLKHLNIEFDKFLEQRKITFDQLVGDLSAGALSRIQMSFIIREIAVQEKITVEKEDLDAEFAKIKDEKLRSQQQLDPRYVDAMQSTVLRQKVADYLFNLK